MKYLMFTAVALVLVACGTDGSFKNPLDMNAEEKCYNARLALAVAEANEVSEDTLAKIATNVELLCPAI